MSDYSYCIVSEQPPRPAVGIWLWLLSFLLPVRGWTQGRASDFGGAKVARLEWVVRFGSATAASRVGMVHTCGVAPTCRCNTDRQFRGQNGAR